jgi:heat shock protein HslJ
MNQSTSWRVLALMLVACGTSEAPSDGARSGLSANCAQPCRDPELRQRSFLLETSQGFVPLAGARVSLRFYDGLLGLGAGCNSISGAFAFRDSRLELIEGGVTEVGCEPAEHAQDEWLQAFLLARPHVTLDADRLTLNGADAELVFLDREVADPDRPLTAGSFSIDTVLTADAAGNLPLASDPTIVFRSDGSLQIDTTCNTGTGQYTAVGQQLALTNVTYTDKACTGASGIADAHLQQVIRNGDVTFEIEAARLTVRRGELGFSGRAP